VDCADDEALTHAWLPKSTSQRRLFDVELTRWLRALFVCTVVPREQKLSEYMVETGGRLLPASVEEVSRC
jgi:hypothetical protein